MGVFVHIHNLNIRMNKRSENNRKLMFVLFFLNCQLLLHTMPTSLHSVPTSTSTKHLTWRWVLALAMHLLMLLSWTRFRRSRMSWRGPCSTASSLACESLLNMVLSITVGSIMDKNNEVFFLRYYFKLLYVEVFFFWVIVFSYSKCMMDVNVEHTQHTRVCTHKNTRAHTQRHARTSV